MERIYIVCFLNVTFSLCFCEQHKKNCADFKILKWKCCVVFLHMVSQLQQMFMY